MRKGNSVLTLLCLLCVFILCTVFVSAEEIVSSNTLTNEDIVKAVETGKLCFIVEGFGHFCATDVEKGTVKVLGVYQEDNEATVYYLFTPIRKLHDSVLRYKPHYNDPHPLPKNEFGPVINGRMELLRFNDGKWFVPSLNKYLVK